MPFGSSTDSPPVLDLRTRRTEAEEMSRWKRHAYLAALLGSLALLVAVLAAELGSLALPNDVPFEVESGHPDEITSVADTLLDLAPGDRIVAIDGIGIAGGTRIMIRERYHLAARRAGRGPYTMTVTDSAGGSPRHVPVSLRPEDGPWDDLASAALFLPGLLALAIGLLALGARERDPSVERFVQLCLVAAVPLLLLALPSVLLGLTAPLLGLDPPGGGWIFAVFVAWPLLFGHVLIRFLHLFVAAGPDVRERYPSPPVPGLVAAIVVACAVALGLLTIVAAVAPDAAGPLDEGFREAFGPLVPSGVLLVSLVIIPTLVIFVAWWLHRATRSVLGLVREGASGDDAELRQKVRLALLGLRTGVVAFATLVVGIVLGSAVFIGLAIAEEMHGMSGTATGPLGTTPFELILPVLYLGTLFLALTAPFAGIGLAVTRQGLWDVDLIASRATVVSVLGVGFVGLWALVDEILEAFVPGRLALAGPLLAGIVVAGVRAPLARVVRSRLFPGTITDVPSAIVRAAGRLADPDPGRDPGSRIATTISDELGARPVATLWRNPAGAPEASWETKDGGTLAEAHLERILTHPSLASGSPIGIEIRSDLGPLLAMPVGNGRAVVLLGPLPSGRLCDAGERRLLASMLAPAGHLFSSGPYL